MRAWLPAALALVVHGAAARAQEAAAPAPDECWRFAFGAWTPPLDGPAAGHDREFGAARPSGMVSGRAPAHAPARRDWAARVPVSGDSALILFPAWWPAGVELKFDPSRSHRDTLRGEAAAFVADGRARVPTPKAVAWRVPCSAPPRASTPDSSPVPPR